MKFPVFMIGDGCDLLFFTERRFLERYVEPPEAKDPASRVFDLDGKELLLRVVDDGPKSRWGRFLCGSRERTVLAEDPTRTPTPEVAKALLADALNPDEDTALRQELEALSLPDLVLRGICARGIKD